MSFFILSLFIVVIFGFWKFVTDSYNISLEESQITDEVSDVVDLFVREVRETRDGADGSFPLSLAQDQEIVFYSDVDDDNLAERVRYYLVGTDLYRQVFEWIPGSTSYPCQGGCNICHKPGESNNDINIPETAWPAHEAHADFLGLCSQWPGPGGGGSPTTSETILSSHVRNGSNPVFYYYNGDWPGDVLNNPIPAGTRLLETRLVTIQLSIDLTENYAAGEFTASSSASIRNLKSNL